MNVHVAGPMDTHDNQTVATATSEKRKVRCYDLPSAFVNTDVDKDVLMVLKGELADMMVQIVPQVYKKYITVNKKGTPMLYVKLQKVLYGLMRTSLLFYQKLRKELERYSFEINPYDPCVANMTTGCKKTFKHNLACGRSDESMQEQFRTNKVLMLPREDVWTKT
jgi:hypothetical protein